MQGDPGQPRGDPSDPARDVRIAETIVWDREERDVSLVRLVNLLLRHRRSLAAWLVAGAGVAVIIGFILPRTWTTSTAFLPQAQQNQLSQLGSLAAQFGVNVPLPTEAGESPQFYAALLQSEPLLEAAVDSRYALTGTGESDTVDLVEVYGTQADTRAEAVYDAAQDLRDDLDVSADATTGLVQFDVHMPDPGLAKGVAERLVALVNSFNLSTRQSQAGAERRFLEGRVRDAQETLLATEDSLQTFLERNRSYQNSPELQFEYQRLQRRVSLRQDVYTTLDQALEQARISEVRNTPVITVVESPEAPPKPDSRGLVGKALLGGTLGFLISLIAAFTREFSKTARQHEPDDYATLATLWADTRRDLRRIRLWFGRFVPRRRQQR